MEHSSLQFADGITGPGSASRPRRLHHKPVRRQRSRADHLTWLWALAGVLGVIALPWHASFDTPLFASPGALFGEPHALAALARIIFRHQFDLLPFVAIPLLASLMALRPFQRFLPGTLIAGGLGGLAWLVACAAMAPNVSVGPGQVLAFTGLIAYLSIGMGLRGYFGGDAFIAGIVILIAALIAIFTMVPTGVMLIRAFDGDGGHFSLLAPFRILFSPRLWELGCVTGRGACGPIWNTLILALGCAVACTTFGFALALLVTRMKSRLSKTVRLLSVLPLITPPFVVGLAFILLFGRSGLVNSLLESMFHIEPTRWIYGLQGIFLAQIFSFTPIAFLVMLSVVEGISPTLEEASQTLHANRHRTFFDITLPLAKPGLVSAFLISFVESLTDFGNPIILGGNVEVLATDIFFAIVGAQQDVGRAATLSGVLLAATLGAFYLQRVILGGGSYATIGGKGNAGNHVPLPDGVRRFCLATGLLWSFLTVTVFTLILIGGFVVNWGRDYTPSLMHYVSAFSITTGSGSLFTGTAWDSLLGTLGIAIVVAPLSTVFGLLTGWVISRQTFRGKGAFELFTFLSLAVPGTVTGVAYVLCFNGPPLELTGTAAIIAICLLFRNLPVAVQTSVAAIAQIDRSLDEASLTMGASSLRTFTRIELPLLRSAVSGNMIYGFVRAVTTVTAVIFLVSAGHELATTFIINRVINGDYGVAVAYSSVLIITCLVALVVIRRAVGTRHLGRPADAAAATSIAIGGAG